MFLIVEKPAADLDAGVHYFQTRTAGESLVASGVAREVAEADALASAQKGAGFIVHHWAGGGVGRVYTPGHDAANVAKVLTALLEPDARELIRRIANGDELPRNVFRAQREGRQCVAS